MLQGYLLKYSSYSSPSLACLAFVLANTDCNDMVNMVRKSVTTNTRTKCGSIQINVEQENIKHRSRLFAGSVTSMAFC